MISFRYRCVPNGKCYSGAFAAQALNHLFALLSVVISAVLSSLMWMIKRR